MKAHFCLCCFVFKLAERLAFQGLDEAGVTSRAEHIRESAEVPSRGSGQTEQTGCPASSFQLPDLPARLQEGHRSQGQSCWFSLSDFVQGD